MVTENQQHTEILSTKIYTWDHSKRPDEHLCKKQSIIYIKHHTYILGLQIISYFNPKLQKNQALITAYIDAKKPEVLSRSF